MEDEDLYKTMKSINYKIDDEPNPQQVLSKQHEQELERIKVLKTIRKKSLLLREKNSRYISKPIVPNEEEFLRELDTANSTKKRNRSRMAIVHQKKYGKFWETPGIKRITRTNDFHGF
jgi:hypothetical protein